MYKTNCNLSLQSIIRSVEMFWQNVSTERMSNMGINFTKRWIDIEHQSIKQL